MNQPTNPAWQGAVTVARARLHTIDEALAKLEATIPNVDVPPVAPPSQPPQYPPPTTPRSQSPLAAEMQHAKNPAPIPGPSLQALEAFMSGAL